MLLLRFDAALISGHGAMRENRLARAKTWPAHLKVGANVVVSSSYCLTVNSNMIGELYEVPYYGINTLSKLCIRKISEVT
jgi:hypothetical protein